MNYKKDENVENMKIYIIEKNELLLHNNTEPVRDFWQGEILLPKKTDAKYIASKVERLNQ